MSFRNSLILLLTLTSAVFGQIPTARQLVLAAMRERPDDPWPRGAGHVLLAVPGSEETQKAYHEPRGSFSPVVKSFGVSIWITSKDGAISKTSDSIPLSGLKQKLVWRNGVILPSISTETDEYQSTWSIGPLNGAYALGLSATPRADHRLALAIRSVGPAGDAH